MVPTARAVGCLTISLLSIATLVSCRSAAHAQSGARIPAMPTTRPGVLNNDPPPVAREFRATWVATVGNIDWPSKPGLSTAEQISEATQILDRCKEMNMNAVILQVRTSADALYESRLEPWSYFLTGEQGKRPDPYYDPLKFWCDEAHKRGIELHAWFNPYRTKYAGAKYKPASNHVSVAHPEFAKPYGKMGWMDPGNPAAEDHSFNVFMDVVERYDVDGIHIDDYFYPYPEKADPDDDENIPFPDDESYKKYTDAGGKLDRAAWRRHNITELIERIYKGIKERKKNVKFGISPFGIPRPGAEGIEYMKSGFDQYLSLNADTVLWLEKGWCDYFVPQCYWKISSGQSFLGLVEWWANHNPKGRNIYPGLFTSKIDWSDESWSLDELFGQIMISRLVPGSSGHVHFSQIALDQNRRGVSEELRDGLYAREALAPASPWLDKSSPAAPTNVKFEKIAGVGERPKWKRPVKGATKPAPEPKQKSVAPMVNPPNATTKPFYPMTEWKTKPTPWLGGLKVTWDKPAGSDEPFLYVIYYKIADNWGWKIVPGGTHEITLKEDSTAGLPARVCVTSVSRIGNESKRTTLVTGYEKPKPAPKAATQPAK